MTGKIYHPEQKHPEPYQHDLNPNASAGMNYGSAGPHPEKNSPTTAYDIQELHDQLGDYSHAELRLIPVMPAGARLETDATYVNLRLDSPRAFQAKGTETVQPDEWIVPKREVPFELWNRLIGVSDPEWTKHVPR